MYQHIHFFQLLIIFSLQNLASIKQKAVQELPAQLIGFSLEDIRTPNGNPKPEKDKL